ncbi:MAG: mannose-1-phosphate guanylyltransferase/mannose-6-phosphate isomerase, partial [Proteobacteria bacterium]|nr:mannose-1-phosphate guanylyltransferase/mannose-6-phosphate isomerase [Pseudomonadota bacterium]
MHQAHPKPFIKMADGESLLLKTLQRALATGASEVLTVTNRDYYFITRDEYS